MVASTRFYSSTELASLKRAMFNVSAFLGSILELIRELLGRCYLLKFPSTLL